MTDTNLKSKLLSELAVEWRDIAANQIDAAVLPGGTTGFVVGFPDGGGALAHSLVVESGADRRWRCGHGDAGHHLPQNAILRALVFASDATRDAWKAARM